MLSLCRSDYNKKSNKKQKHKKILKKNKQCLTVIAIPVIPFSKSLTIQSVDIRQTKFKLRWDVYVRLAKAKPLTA